MMEAKTADVEKYLTKLRRTVDLACHLRSQAFGRLHIPWKILLEYYAKLHGPDATPFLTVVHRYQYRTSCKDF